MISSRSQLGSFRLQRWAKGRTMRPAPVAAQTEDLGLASANRMSDSKVGLLSPPSGHLGGGSATWPKHSARPNAAEQLATRSAGSSGHASSSQRLGTESCSAQTRVTTQSGAHPNGTPECRSRGTPFLILAGMNLNRVSRQVWVLILAQATVGRRFAPQGRRRSHWRRCSGRQTMRGAASRTQKRNPKRGRPSKNEYGEPDHRRRVRRGSSSATTRRWWRRGRSSWW